MISVCFQGKPFNMTVIQVYAPTTNAKKAEVEWFYEVLTKPSISSVESVTQSCPTLCNPMNRSMPGLPVPHHLPEFTQIHVHRVSDAIQPSHPLSSPSPPAPSPSHHQGLFQWVNFAWGGQSIGVSALALVLPMNTQDWSPCSPRDLKSLLQHHSSKASILQPSAFFIVQLSHHDYWKNHSFD